MSTGSTTDLERESLLRYLDRLRTAVVDISADLPDEDLRRPLVASGTNLLGLIQHLAGVERHWFQVVFMGDDVECNLSMEVDPTRSHAEVVEDYRQACTVSNQIIRSEPDLGALSAAPNPGEHDLVPLRRIVAHMIEETGRHAGHADILRELIDGVTGR